MNETNKNLFYILMILAMAGWGASWVNAKILSSYINEYELIFFRNFFTIISMLPILIFLKKSFKINKHDFLLAFIASIIMIIYMVCYFLGTKYGTASLGGALVTSLIPIVTFIIMAIFFKKETSKKQVFALFLGVIGVSTMLHIWSFSLEVILKIENAYFLLGSLLWALLTITSSKTKVISPFMFMFYIYIISTFIISVFFMDFTNIKYENFDSIFWINILFLSIVATTFATSIYFIGIEKLGVNEVSSFIFLVPFFAISLSIIFLDEKVEIYLVLGTILTLLAVKILNNVKFFNKKS